VGIKYVKRELTIYFQEGTHTNPNKLRAIGRRTFKFQILWILIIIKWEGSDDEQIGCDY